ncbi:MAG TPA: energy transducer TonB [Thermoanaerobaculia bacterium]|jgi:TonB family protein|nr:energy transducer TonB [Thermoanaerobaculia bacterium]
MFVRCLKAFTAAVWMANVAHATSVVPATRSIVTRLRHFEVKEFETDVPPTVARDLTALKHALRDLIVEIAGAPGAATAPPSMLTARVIARLASQDVPVGDDCGCYGAITRIELWRPPEYPAWLIATTTLSVPYGGDTSVYLFEIAGSSWKHVLTQEANGYSDIAGAQGSLQLQVSPAPAGEEPYLITTDVPPWPTSTWLALRLKILRIGKTPESPRALADRALAYNLDEDSYLSLHARSFELIWLGWTVNRELAGFRGVHYLRYAVSAKRAVVVRSIAFDPNDLLRSWAARPWSAAARIVAPAARSAARQWHRRLRRRGWGCGLGPLRLGRGDHGKLLAEAGCEHASRETSSVYFVLTPGRRSFRIAGIATSPLDLPDRWQVVYAAGDAELTAGPVPECIVRPKLPPDLAATVALGAQPVAVLVSIVVAPDGTVASVLLRDWPAEPAGLAVAAVEAVRSWQFEPGRKDGQPVSVSLEVRVEFEP